MPNRVREIMIISSPYDAFIMEEDGGLLEHVFMRVRGVSLIEPPKITVVSSFTEALDMLAQKTFDIIVSMPKIIRNDLFEFGKKAKRLYKNVPIILLAHSTKSLAQFRGNFPTGAIDRIFTWSGDRNILWTILKWWEDKINVAHDTELAMVRVLILIEDSPFYYSSLLPILYQSIVKQTQAVLDDSLNEEHRLMKLRARTKILLASSYEEAMELYTQYRPYILAIFSDTRFPKDGQLNPNAGIEFLSKVKKEYPDLSLLLLSTENSNKSRADEIAVKFQDKNSPSLHLELKRFLVDYMGFGDFIFRMPNGVEVTRAANLATLEKVLETVHRDSLAYHAKRHHFSSWLLARSEITLAATFRSILIEDYTDVDILRKELIAILENTRILRQKGIILSFRGEGFDPETTFFKINDGSLGGKARGIAFMIKYLQENIVHFSEFKNINVAIPKTLVLSTDCFDEFMEENNFEDFSEVKYSDKLVSRLFSQAKIPKKLEADLRAYLEKVNYPIAVRSSSLLEDNKDGPFAGLYSTYMLPNNHSDINERLRQLSLAIRLVFASVFFRGPRAFSRNTLHRTEEEKMAVLVQEVVGKRYDNFYYPTISGTAQSHNFYPLNFMKAEEGIVNLSMGFGKIIVEGGQTLRFSPAYPQNIAQFSTVNDILANSQKYFYAMDMRPRDNSNDLWIDEEAYLTKRDISDAINEAPVRLLSSTFSPDDNIILDNFSPAGGAIITFASLLKQQRYQIPAFLSKLLQLGRAGLGCEIEIEFAINIPEDPLAPCDFYLLQTRPMTTLAQEFDVEISDTDIQKAFCHSTNALGIGEYIDVNNIIYIRPGVDITQASAEIVKEITELNQKMRQNGVHYLLIGPGRWGSSDPHLGIPVSWNDISNVSGIIETSPGNFKADPSQGTHFFQNITSLGITYMTVAGISDFLQWDFLEKQEIVSTTKYLKHIRTSKNITSKINSKKNIGILLINE